MVYHWVHPKPWNVEKLSGIIRSFNLHPVIAQILYNRNIDTPEKVERFFRSDLKDLHDPFLLNDMEPAVLRIIKALQEGENILIYGDYDVDGVTSVSILYDGLFRLGGKVYFFIPDRFREGYGVSKQGIRAAKRKGTSLIITVDCGITAVDEVQYAHELGIDMIICDHHEASEQIPDAVAVIDPKIRQSQYPFKELAGCGVSFKVLQAVAAKLGYGDAFTSQYLDLVAIGTSADIVPLVDENRIFVKHGLQKINSKTRPGIFALQESCGLIDRRINVSTIVFIMAPRLNAVGRISNAKKAVHLLTTQSYQQGRNIARILEKENKERRSIDDITFEEAQRYIQDRIDISHKRILVLAKENWHTGVIGIVASRIMEKFNRPVVLISVEDGVGKGSARSIADFDIYDTLHRLGHLLVNFGGHQYAAGLTINRDKIEAFDEAINKLAMHSLRPEAMVPKLFIDAEIRFNQLNVNFLNGLKRLAPFGPQNMRPVLLSSELSTFGGVFTVGQNHLKTKFKQDGVVIDAIGYKLGTYSASLKKGNTPVSCAYVLEENQWNGQTTIQMRIKDLEVKHE